MASVNWNEIFDEAENFDDSPPSAGKHLCRIESLEFGTSQKGDPQLRLRFVVLGGSDKGKALWVRHTFVPTSPRALQINVRQIAAYGLDRKMLVSHSEDDLVNLVVGRHVNVTVENSTYKGQPSANVKNVEAAQGSAPPSTASAPPPSNAATPPPSDGVPPPFGG